MKTIAIIHFSPLELYPPVQNFIDQLQKAGGFRKLVVVTRANTVTELTDYKVWESRVEVVRFADHFRPLGQLLRFFNYLSFYFVCIYSLLRHSPSVVFYYETLSAFPVYLYKKFFNRKAKVFIHYHEYTSPEELRSGMRIVKGVHKLERSLYPEAKWISHTNLKRLELFKADIKPINVENGFVYPNYPPRAWFSEPSPISRMPIRVVYAGALSLTTMYTKEFSEWIVNQKGKILWDIYSYNCTSDAREYLTNLSTPWINLKRGVDYSQLPSIFKGYNVGVILYNGHIPNYIHNAPNKLFEYLACGLSVWFPEVMMGCRPFITKGTIPEVVSLDFNSLERYKAEDFIRPCSDYRRSPSFDNETASLQLLNLILND